MAQTLAQMNVLPIQTYTLVEELIATLPPVIQSLLSKRGQILKLVCGRPMKVKKGCGEIIKYSDVYARVGLNYDNMKDVKAKREDGTLPPENAGLMWGQYVPGLFPYIISHKDNLYFRFFTVNNNPHANRMVKFVRNGKEISREEAKRDSYASEFAERETTLETFTLKIESILEINGVPV